MLKIRLGAVAHVGQLCLGDVDGGVYPQMHCKDSDISANFQIFSIELIIRKHTSAL